MIDETFNLSPGLLDPCVTDTGKKALLVRVRHRGLERVRVIYPDDGMVIFPRDLL